MNQLAPWIRCVCHGNNKVHRANEALKQLGFAFLSYLGQDAGSFSVFLQLRQFFCRSPLPSYWRFFSFSDKKKVLGAFYRRCWDAACCSRTSPVRDYRCSWLAVKRCSNFPLILWLYVQFLDLLFFIVNFLYFHIFHNFHIFTLNWYSQLFQISVFAGTLIIFATPHVG